MHELQQVTERRNEKLVRELGPLVASCLEDHGTEDILLNPDGRVWVKRTHQDFEVVGSMLPAQALSAFGTIAAIRDTVINHENPILETELPTDGSRFEGLIPPVVRQPVFAIRQRPHRVFTLNEYETAGILTDNTDELAAISPDDRVLIIEDTPELQCNVKNSVALLAVGRVSMLDCLRACMRLKPTRIVVGEVRGAEALSMLKAWNTGHPGGAASVHANDAHGALIRLESLVAEATAAPQQQLIAEAVNLVVFVDGEPSIRAGRKVREVAVVTGFSDGDYKLEYV